MPFPECFAKEAEKILLLSTTNQITEDIKYTLTATKKT